MYSIIGGWTVEDTVALSKILSTMGVDIIDISAGGNLPWTHPNNTLKSLMPFPIGYQVPFAERVKKAVPSLHVMAVGNIHTGIMTIPSSYHIIVY